MNIFKLLVELFVIYMVYKLVFGFIIPVYRTTKHMKQKMNEMHERMQEQEDANSNRYTNLPGKQAASKKAVADDYIEYEEIR